MKTQPDSYASIFFGWFGRHRRVVAGLWLLYGLFGTYVNLSAIIHIHVVETPLISWYVAEGNEVQIYQIKWYMWVLNFAFYTAISIIAVDMLWFNKLNPFDND